MPDATLDFSDAIASQPEISSIAVLRNTSTGVCILVDCGKQENLDLERLEESWLELAGWLEREEQYLPYPHDAEDCACEDLESNMLCFTECSRDDCEKMIAILEGGAPEFCSEHGPGVWETVETRKMSEFIAGTFEQEATEWVEEAESTRDAAETLAHEMRAAHEQHGAAMGLTLDDLDAVNWYEIAKNISQGC